MIPPGYYTFASSFLIITLWSPSPQPSNKGRKDWIQDLNKVPTGIFTTEKMEKVKTNLKKLELLF